jgi:hypothetical protein
MQVALFLLALPALVTPFVSFTYGTSPIDVVPYVPEWGSDNWILALLAVEFFAAFPDPVVESPATRAAIRAAAVVGACDGDGPWR